MPLPQAPTYLTQSAKAAINDTARAAVGSSLPPHISIQGNTFTLIDAAGNEYQGGPVIQAVVIDVSDVTCKMWFGGKEWTPGSNDEPVCWSTNGIGPSINAAQPQARTCAECELNKRGSAVSKMTGSPIKACRDETHLALMFPQQPQMIFRLVITPGSFKNWGAYLDSIKGVALQDLVTQFEFVPKENGVLQFSAPAYIPQETLQWREQAYLEGKTDAFVGRGDKPRAALPAPAVQPVLPNATTVLPPAEMQQVQQPAPFPSQMAAPAPNAASSGQPTPSPAPTVATTSPSEPTRRRRRAAEPAAQPAQAQPSFAPAAAPAPVAPFRPAQPTASAGPAFGIGQGTAPNPELASMLNNIFPQQKTG